MPVARHGQHQGTDNIIIRGENETFQPGLSKHTTVVDRRGGGGMEYGPLLAHDVGFLTLGPKVAPPLRGDLIS